MCVHAVWLGPTDTNDYATICDSIIIHTELLVAKIKSCIPHAL